MKFRALPLAAAENHILGHNITGEGGKRMFRKGKALAAEDLTVLRTLGHESVYVAQLAPDDVDENTAAERIAQAISGPELRRSQAQTGRVNFYAPNPGILRVDRERLLALNCQEGVTAATLPTHTAVAKGKMVATLKIIPYALPDTTVRAAEALATAPPPAGVSAQSPLIALQPFIPRQVGLILSGSPAARERIVRSFGEALSPRLLAWGATLATTDFVPLEDERGERQLSTAVRGQLTAGIDLLILAGETAIMDREDIAPRALLAAGATLECFGAPVDPGNLLLLAYHGQVPIVGAPGCARSLKRNIVDLILPRLLVGDRLTRRDILELGHGGLLEDVPERPLPRSWLT